MIGKWGEFNTYPPLNVATVDGAAAGDITVAGLKPIYTLVAVVDVAAAGANLVSEFTITDTNTINNTGGTDTTGMLLLVVWYSGDAGL